MKIFVKDVLVGTKCSEVHLQNSKLQVFQILSISIKKVNFHLKASNSEQTGGLLPELKKQN